MKYRIFQCLGFSLALFAFGLAAQGSIIPQPSTRSPDGGDPRRARNASPDYGLYDYGREIYAIKLGCSDCILGDKPVNENYAKKFFLDDSLRAGLSEAEEEAVSVYLRQLFGLIY